jgi:hypothetical protein
MAVLIPVTRNAHQKAVKAAHDDPIHDKRAESALVSAAPGDEGCLVRIGEGVARWPRMTSE